MKNNLYTTVITISKYLLIGFLSQSLIFNAVFSKNKEARSTYPACSNLQDGSGKGISRIFKLDYTLSSETKTALPDLTISGKVTNPSGNPLIGVSIEVKGTNKGTVTDANGHYRLICSQNAILIFSYIGYQTREIAVDGKEVVNVILSSSATGLNQVVVIGYGTVQKKDLTGSVATVSGKVLSAVPVANVAQALQGKLPGVNIVSQDGRPDASVSITVRGGGSISQSNQPLVLIDGVPGSLSDVPADEVESIDVLKDASSTAIYGARGANGVILVTTKAPKAGKVTITYNGYMEINTPMKYLKALGPYDYLQYVWANAAANGSAYEQPFEQLFGIGSYTTKNPKGIEAYKNMPSDNIQKKVYNSSVSWNHNLTITGGSEKTRVLFSTNYTDNQGMKLNSYFKRENALFKLDQEIFNNVTFHLETRYIDIQDFGNEGTTNGGGSLLSTSYEFRPIATSDILGDLDALQEGNIEQYGESSLWDIYNPAAIIKDYYPLTTSQNVYGVGGLNWKIIKGLTYNSTIYLNRLWGQQNIWSGAIYNDYLNNITGQKLFAGNAEIGKSNSWGLRWTNTLDYDFSTHHIGKFNLLIGQETSNSGGNGMDIQANHFPPNYDRETAFAQINQYDQTSGSATFSSSDAVPVSLVSYFGRANYSLKDRYLLTLTFRADGSSKFSPIHRWGYFPAGAAAWRLTEEPFMKNINWLDNLKLRVSYGEVGNDGINSSLWSQSWTAENDQRWQYAINQQRQAAYTLSSPTLANKELKWETTITRDIGTDFSLCNYRLSGTVDVYWNTTKNLLMLATIPGITGFTSSYENIGQTSNKGVEISLTGIILQNKNWKLTAGGNISFNKNNIDKLSPDVTGLYGADWGGIASYPADDYVLQAGRPVGLVRGLVYEGFYTVNDFNYENGMYILKKGIPDLGNILGVIHGIPSGARPAGQIAYPGLPKFKDLNQDGVIDDNDITVIGNMNPKFTGGFNFSATYKNFDLGLSFNWSVGNDIYNANKLADLYGPKEAGVYQNKLAIMKNSYKIYDVVNGQLQSLTTPDELEVANKNATLPLAYNEVGTVSTLGIENGSYLRLNLFTLGYTLSKSLLSKVKINSLRIYGSVYNLLTLTKYSGLDPEVNVDPNHNHAIYPTPGLDYGAYPRPRSFVFGLNFTF